MQENQISEVKRLQTIIEARTKQLQDITLVLQDTQQKLEQEIKDESTLDDLLEDLTKKVTNQEERIQDTLKEKELIFSKLQTALEDIEKMPRRQQSSGWLGYLSSPFGFGSKKKTEEEFGFIQTSSGLIKKELTKPKPEPKPELAISQVESSSEKTKSTEKKELQEDPIIKRKSSTASNESNEDQRTEQELLKSITDRLGDLDEDESESEDDN